MAHSVTSQRLTWRFSLATLLLVVAASALLQSQPVARAAGPARAPGHENHSPSGSVPGVPGVMPSWFKTKVVEGNLLDRLKQRRLVRGDAAGAARVDSLRKWFSLFGLYRGLPALGMDLFRHRGLAAEIAQDWARLMERFAAAPAGNGPGLVARGQREVPELLAINQAAVLEWVRLALRKARKAFQGGAVSRLLSDIYTEVASDPLFVSDVLQEAEALGFQAHATVTLRGEGWLPEQLTALAQQVLEIAREELFPNKPSSGGFFSFFGRTPPKRQAPVHGPGGKGGEL